MPVITHKECKGTKGNGGICKFCYKKSIKPPSEESEVLFLHDYIIDQKLLDKFDHDFSHILKDIKYDHVFYIQSSDEEKSKWAVAETCASLILLEQLKQIRPLIVFCTGSKGLLFLQDNKSNVQPNEMRFYKAFNTEFFYGKMVSLDLIYNQSVLNQDLYLNATYMPTAADIQMKVAIARQHFKNIRN